jgi:hypothetical protein
VAALVALVTLLNLALSLVVGLRLLGRARRGWPAPETSLAVYFLASSFLATPPQVIVYGAMGDPRLALPEAASRLLLGFAVLAMAVGAAGVYVFTWKTFRPDRWWAKAIVACGCTALAAGWLLELFREGFAPVIFAGFGHWLGWAGRTAAMAGVTFESFRYWTLLRRRGRLGLADPLVTDRFLLWSIWAAAGTVNYLADLVSRGIYVLVFGTTEAVPELLATIVPVTLALTMLTGCVSAATLFLTFFPTPAYVRWVSQRGRARPA